jgi:hypothetical protein
MAAHSLVVLDVPASRKQGRIRLAVRRVQVIG